MPDVKPIFIPVVLSPEQARALFGAANVVVESAPTPVLRSPQGQALIDAMLELGRKYDEAMGTDGGFMGTGL
jgi:hypothetical protein